MSSSGDGQFVSMDTLKSAVRPTRTSILAVLFLVLLFTYVTIFSSDNSNSRDRAFVVQDKTMDMIRDFRQETGPAKTMPPSMGYQIAMSFPNTDKVASGQQTRRRAQDSCGCLTVTDEEELFPSLSRSNRSEDRDSSRFDFLNLENLVADDPTLPSWFVNQDKENWRTAAEKSNDSHLFRYLPVGTMPADGTGLPEDVEAQAKDVIAVNKIKDETGDVTPPHVPHPLSSGISLYTAITWSAQACAALCFYELVNGGKPCVIAVFQPALKVCYLKSNIIIPETVIASATDNAVVTIAIRPDILKACSCTTGRRPVLNQYRPKESRLGVHHVSTRVEALGIDAESVIELESPDPVAGTIVPTTASRSNTTATSSKMTSSTIKIDRPFKRYSDTKSQPGHDVMLTVYLTGDECAARCNLMPSCVGIVATRDLCFFKRTPLLAQSSDAHTAFFRIAAPNVTGPVVMMEKKPPPAEEELRQSLPSGASNISTSSSSRTGDEQVTNTRSKPSYTGSAKRHASLSGIVFGVLLGPDYLLTRLLPILDTWLYDVESALFVESTHFDTVLRFVQRLQKFEGLGLRTTVVSLNVSLYNSAQGGSINGAWKNLPIAQHLYDMYPNRQWYSIVDDDTFIVQQNLNLVLQRYNQMPTTAWYIGANFMSSNENDAFLFAQGGAGIFYNHVAASILQPKLVSGFCYEMCQQWAGDIRLGCCFNFAKVKPPHHPEFWSMTPFNALTRDKRAQKAPFPASFHQLREPTWTYDLFWATTAAGIWNATPGGREALIRFFTKPTPSLMQALHHNQKEHQRTSSQFKEGHEDNTQRLSLVMQLMGPMPSFIADWASSPQWVGCRQLKAGLEQLKFFKDGPSPGLGFNTSEPPSIPQAGGVDDFLCNMKLGYGKLRWSTIYRTMVSQWKGTRYPDVVYRVDGYMVRAAQRGELAKARFFGGGTDTPRKQPTSEP